MSIVWQISGVVGLTCGSASAIIIGKAIGEGIGGYDYSHIQNPPAFIFTHRYHLQPYTVCLTQFHLSVLFALNLRRRLARKMILALCVIVFAPAISNLLSSGIILGGGNSRYSLHS
jgi:hypothetical protein